MVSVFTGGDKIGTLQLTPRLIAECYERNSPIEFRNDAGEV